MHFFIHNPSQTSSRTLLKRIFIFTTRQEQLQELFYLISQCSSLIPFSFLSFSPSSFPQLLPPHGKNTTPVPTSQRPITASPGISPWKSSLDSKRLNQARTKLAHSSASSRRKTKNGTFLKLSFNRLTERRCFSWRITDLFPWADRAQLWKRTVGVKEAFLILYLIPLWPFLKPITWPWPSFAKTDTCGEVWDRTTVSLCILFYPHVVEHQTRWVVCLFFAEILFFLDYDNDRGIFLIANYGPPRLIDLIGPDYEGT